MKRRTHNNSSEVCGKYSKTEGQQWYGFHSSSTAMHKYCFTSFRQFHPPRE